MAKVAILMADYGHDPSETAVPFTAFKEAGYSITFVTEHGAVPKCDAKMLEGITQVLLGAKKSVVEQYRQMTQTAEWQSPLVLVRAGLLPRRVRSRLLPRRPRKGRAAGH
ncbi:hypothetical protein NQ176_g8811 [Zarea fungicola]|uniref:Uncharacterized protein n=1 Tax=Zarea fungicola TaxID=93591 RepID=A0ACC1MS42_9HYPO|nr:hypothetical protein NQ176_g8811 [Lecanicillium fungicola]